MAKGDKYLKGQGKVWLDSLLYAECYKCSFTRKDEFEEIPDPNGYGKVQVWLGTSYEGSMTLRKDGAMPILTKLEASKGYEFDIIVKEYNTNTGYYETKKYVDCTVEEFPTSTFESRKITEVELQVKARKMEILA